MWPGSARAENRPGNTYRCSASGVALDWKKCSLLRQPMGSEACSLRFDLALDDHFLPLLEFGAREGGALLRAGAARLDPDLGKRRLQLGVLQHLVDLAVEPRQ